MDLAEKIGQKENDQVTAQFSASRLAKEKEMLENQNKWLNEELASKSKELLELQKLQVTLKYLARNEERSAVVHRLQCS